MPLLLLRLLLVVALVFNGAATAAAAVHAIHPDGAHATGHSQPAAADQAPCHEHGQAGAAEAPAPAADDGGSQAPSPDCCQSGACLCACAHNAPLALGDPGFAAPLVEHAGGVRPMPSGHADAALPNLIRPPIA